MSYLTTPELKSFDKCVISFWVRVPQAAMDAAANDPDSNADNPPPMSGLVPLLVFGKEGTSSTTDDESSTSQTNTTTTSVHSCVMNFSDSIDYPTYTANWWSECTDSISSRDYYTTTISHSTKPGQPTNPSFIAVDGYGNLVINFESTQVGDVTMPDVITGWTSEYYVQTSVNECWTYSFLADCTAGGSTVTADPPGNIWSVLEIVFTMLGYRLATAVADKLVDQGSSPKEDHPATTNFGAGVGDVGTGAINFGQVYLTADTWHHILISFDGSGGSASTGIPVGGNYEDIASHITATSLLYVAVDDVNYPTGSWIFPDSNKIVTGGAMTIASMGQAVNYVDNGDGTYTAVPEGPVPSYSANNLSVPTAPVGIPSVGKYVDKIHKVEMAELLIFTGAVLDTSVEKNRRLFITKPDKNGKQYPVNPSPVYVPISKYAVGDPTTWDWSTGPDSPAFVPPLSADDPTFRGSGNKTLGKPDIDFTVSSIPWQSGMNLGTLKGKVVKTGKIKAYSPDPSINAGGG